MRLNVKEAGADGIFLNRWKCSFGTQALFPMKYFRWKKKKKSQRDATLYTHSPISTYILQKVGRGRF